MDLISLIIALIIIGLLLYVVETLLPIDPTIKRVIHVVIIVVVILWLVRVLLGGGVPAIRIG